MRPTPPSPAPAAGPPSALRRCPRDRPGRAAGPARSRDADAADEAALPPRRRTRRAGHRPRSAVGPSRSPPRAARRGSHRPRRRHPADPPQSRRVPVRQTPPHLAAARVLDLRRYPGRPGHARMDRPGGEPGRRRAVGHRQVSLRRGHRPRRHRSRPAGGLVHPRDTHRDHRPAKIDGSVARTVTRICRSDLIVIDDIGMLPAGQDAAEAFYRITDAAYERRSVAVTSNIHPSGFDTIMPKTLATATVDRLMHHAHLVLTKGDSHRLAEALAGKGVIPLAT